MTEEKRKELFNDVWDDLSIDDKVAIYNNYCYEHGDASEALEPFDEDFFTTFFQDPYEAARATFFGDIENWMDDYIYFNAYGNLESMDKYQAEEQTNNYKDDIYEYPDTWEDYITIEEEDDEDEEPDE